MSTVSKPLKWHGGKHYLAKRIIELMPPHLHYVEPYFGAGAVLFRRDPNRDWFINEAWKLQNGEKVPASLRGCSEIINDLNGDLANFWSVLASKPAFDEFLRIVEATPFSQEHWKQCSVVRADSLEDRSMAAAAFFVRYRQSRQGLGKNFATMTRERTRRNMNEQVSSWLSAIDGLPDAHDRLKRVVVFSDDALKVIKQQDGPKVLFYCDPPYLHEIRVTTGNYEHEMTFEQHDALVDLLDQIKGKFILSGYHSNLYDDMALTCGWHCEEIEIDNKASRKKTKDKKIECLWMNYDPQEEDALEPKKPRKNEPKRQ